MMRAIWKCLAITLLCSGSLATRAETPELGKKAADFTLSTPDGRRLRLSELTAKGNVALIVLRGFPGYQCPYCQKQVHDFIANADKFAATGTQILLVYPGPAADVDQKAKEALAKQNPLPPNIHLVVDPDYVFTNQYGLRWDAPHETAYPSTFLIDRNGNVLFRKISRVHGERTTAEDVLSEVQRAKAPR